MKSVVIDGAGSRLRWAEFPERGRLGGVAGRSQGRRPACPVRVYLHGLGSTGLSAFWPVLTNPMMGQARALVPDLLGFGLSDRPGDCDYSLDTHADAVAVALDEAGVSGVDLIGHSMGGSIGLVLARRRPDLVDRIVLIEPNLDPWDGGASVTITRQSEAEFVNRGFASLIGDGPEPWAATLRIADPVGLYRSAVGLCHGSTPTMREILLGLDFARTLIWGALSPAPSGLDDLRASGVTFREIAGSGHVPMEDNPDQLAEVLDGILGAA